MQPQKAQKIIDSLHSHGGPLSKNRERKHTVITEVGTDGDKIFYMDDAPLQAQAPTTPGEFVVVRNINVGLGHQLAAIARLGYLITERPEYIDLANTDPQLELISHSNSSAGTAGSFTESVFRDHNPHR